LPGRGGPGGRRHGGRLRHRAGRRPAGPGPRGGRTDRHVYSPAGPPGPPGAEKGASMTETAGEPAPPEGVEVRRAAAGDLAEIVALLADDPLGAARENGADLAPYRAAFAEIDADPGQFLAVAVRGARVVGTLQLTFVPGCPAARPSAPRSRRSGCTATSAAPASAPT